MVLEVAKRLVKLGRDAALRIPRDGHIHDADLWISTHGFAGGFYAVWETLHNVEQDGDPTMKAAIAAWRATARGDYDKRAGEMRNRITHQGIHLTTQSNLEWEESVDHDTVFPKRVNVFATRTMADGSMRELSFADWANDLFWWWESQLAEIERIYNRKVRAAAHGGDDR